MNTIITISRQFGSGGHEIGEKIAEHYGIKCYDRELVSLASKESGFSQDIVENQDERKVNSFLYNLAMENNMFGYNIDSLSVLPDTQKIFLAQFDAIRNLAKSGPCVMVGRCADYALSDLDNCINFFIYGNMKTKIERIMKKYELPEETAKEMIIKKDKQREGYYNYYSAKKWGQADGYHLCLNSSILGIDETVKLLIHYIDAFENKKLLSVFGR